MDSPVSQELDSPNIPRFVPAVWKTSKIERRPSNAQALALKLLTRNYCRYRAWICAETPVGVAMAALLPFLGSYA